MEKELLGGVLEEEERRRGGSPLQLFFPSKLGEEEKRKDENGGCEDDVGSYQLYIDTAINAGNGKIRLGVVIKDWNGNVIAGLSAPIAA
uniref:Uncharacterized protein n=1 Tax=Cannabis sativa TaxID=3483 RepID=A0A803P995_CANSA